MEKRRKVLDRIIEYARLISSGRRHFHVQGRFPQGWNNGKMNTSTKNDIIGELYKSIVQHGCNNQRFRQLRSCLSKEDPLLVGDSLLSYWEDLAESDFGAQTFVASLLFAINPPTSFPLNQILLTLPKWNLSVEEFPWYLATQFGEERVLQELDILERESPDIEGIAHTIQTARWWLKGDYRAARSEYE